MNITPSTPSARPSVGRQGLIWLVLAVLSLAAAAAWAQDDPPGRVGRLAEVQGGVSWFDHEQGAWQEAERNLPLTSGDRLSTSAQGRAEVRVGSTVLRLAGATELEVLRLDDEQMTFQLHAGSLALRVRSRELAAETEVRTAEAPLRPLVAGHYRFDRIDDTTQAGVWRGALRIDDDQGFIVEAGQRAELWREGGARNLRFAWRGMPSDALANWVAQEDRADERSASSRYVSPEMTGAEDLDRNGRWERHPEYGAVWFPFEVQLGWAPYRYGHWAWVRPWGWTWVDDAPWGFAPFHYGRWVSWHGRWGWVPGEYVARPVFAPALVAWVGGPQLSVSISIGGPTVGWLPLAPRDWYAPHYRHTPRYVERVNPRPPGHRGPWQGPRGPQHEPSGRVTFGNQLVPGAVTIVAREVVERRRHVGPVVVAPGNHRGGAREPLVSLPPPAREAPPRRSPDARTPFEREMRGPQTQPQPAPAFEVRRQTPEREAARPPQPSPRPGQALPPPPPFGVPDRVPENRRQRPRPDGGAQGPQPGAGEPAPRERTAPVTRPMPRPAPVPAAAPRPVPTSPPERARQREAEREPAAAEERKRGPENRGSRREHER